jgi:hypothetical protein
VLQVILAGAIIIVRDGFKSLIAMVLNTVGSIANAFAWLTDKLSVLPGAAGEAFASMSASLSSYGDVLSEVTHKTDEATAKQAGFNDGLDDTASSANKAGAALAKMNPGKPYKDLKTDMQGAKDAAGKAADDMATDWQKAGESMQKDIGNALDSVSIDFNDLRGTALNALEAIGSAIIKNLGNAILGGSGGGGGGGFGGFNMGGGGGGFDMGSMLSSVGDWFGGFFADGGNFMGGKPMVVGEKGAEIITPRTGGTVTPNHELGGNKIVNNFNFPPGTDVQSFRRSQGQIAAQMAQVVQQGGRNL